MIAELIQTVKEEKKLLASVIVASNGLSKKDKVLSRYGLEDNQIEDFDYGSKVDEQLNQFCQRKIVENTTEEECFMSAWEKLGFENRNLMVKKLKAFGEISLAERLADKVVMFSDILKLSDSVIKKFLEKSENGILTLALKDICGDYFSVEAQDKIREKIYANLEQGKMELLKEDLYFMGPVRKVDILEARRNICGKLKGIIFDEKG